MITAIVIKENQWQKGQVDRFNLAFKTIGEIEHYLAYNRAYIKSIEFKGKIQEKEEE